MKPRQSRKYLEQQVASLEYANKTQSCQRMAESQVHKEELAALSRKLHERDLQLKEQIARACSQMIEALARMISPGTF